jgi:hypothetical protein
MFATLACHAGMWLTTNDAGHCWIVGSYFHFAGGFENIHVADISPDPGKSDPMFVISATKSQKNTCA